jgi:hypothetical protein
LSFEHDDTTPGGAAVRTLMILHEVDDVDQWLASARRRELFGPFGITTRTFVDPAQTHRVGLIVEVPSMEIFDEAIGSLRAAEAMQCDGVRRETVRVLTEA